jgi:hypothetical protein
MEDVVSAPIEQVMQVRERLLESISSPPEHEEIVRLDANYGIQREAFIQLLEGEETGEYDEDSVDISIVQAVDDAATNQLAIFDMEYEVEIDEGNDMGDMPMDAEMSSSGQYASFSQGYGEILAGLIERTYENPQHGITDVASAGGLSPADVQGAIRGELAFDPDTNSAIAQVFDLNQQQHNEFVQLGNQAYNEIISQSQPAAAQMSGAVDHELRAEFAQQRNEKEIGQALKDLERRANAAFDRGVITPTEHYQLAGGLIEERDDRVAAFSAFCHQAQVDPWVQVYASNHTLNFLEQRGPVMEFSAISDTSPLNNIDASDVEAGRDVIRRAGGYQ